MYECRVHVYRVLCMCSQCVCVCMCVCLSIMNECLQRGWPLMNAACVLYLRATDIAYMKISRKRQGKDCLRKCVDNDLEKNQLEGWRLSPLLGRKERNSHFYFCSRV